MEYFWLKSQSFHGREKHLVQAGKRTREAMESEELSKAFEEIGAGLEDAIVHAKGRKGSVIVHEPEIIDVKAIRKKTGMSQQRFCATFGISLGTLRHWEQGLRSPRGPARALLKVVDHNPNAVIHAISQKRHPNETYHLPQKDAPSVPSQFPARFCQTGSLENASARKSVPASPVGRHFSR